MPRFRLRVEYDGTDFQGWQSQAEARVRTVQDVLEAAVADLVGQPTAVLGAGRTDAGVHAEGQVASFAAETRFTAREIRRALNARLPEDVAVRACEIVDPGFHPRRDAVSKLYRYAIWNDPEPSPLRRRRWHRVAAPLDASAMARAGQAFEGRHDFASLQSAGGSQRTSERTLLRCEVRAARREITLWVEGSGFLRHMVRTLAGTLIEVGLGRRSPDGIPALLAAADRAAAGPTAPAHGLTLVAVRYPDDPPATGFPRETGALS